MNRSYLCLAMCTFQNVNVFYCQYTTSKQLDPIKRLTYGKMLGCTKWMAVNKQEPGLLFTSKHRWRRAALRRVPVLLRRRAPLPRDLPTVQRSASCRTGDRRAAGTWGAVLGWCCRFCVTPDWDGGGRGRAGRTVLLISTQELVGYRGANGLQPARVATAVTGGGWWCCWGGGVDGGPVIAASDTSWVHRWCWHYWNNSILQLTTYRR